MFCTYMHILSLSSFIQISTSKELSTIFKYKNLILQYKQYNLDSWSFLRILLQFITKRIYPKKCDVIPN